MKPYMLPVICLIMIVSSCKKDGDFDYRQEYVGIYACTKSIRSFEDDLFAVDIDDIVISMHSDSMVVVNDARLLVKPDGTTGRVVVDSNVYDLSFEGDSLRLFTHPDIVGFFSYCYIKGVKI